MRWKALGFVLPLAAAAACSSPTIHLSLGLKPGTERTYSLTSTTRSRYDIGGVKGTETTSIATRVTMRVVAAGPKPGVATIEIKIVPTSFARDGKKAEPPDPQTITVTADALARIGTFSTTGTVIDKAEDVATLLGAPLKEGIVHLGDRWTGKGRSSRIASLRIVDGKRCAVIVTAGATPTTQQRRTQAGTVTLNGTETASRETAFAFDGGYPVSIDSRSHANLSGQQGSVVADTTTLMTLLTNPAKATTTTRTGTGTPSTGSPGPRQSSARRPSQTTTAPAQSP